MTQTSSSGQEVDALLVGSLGVFALPEVLTLVAASRGRGRLQVTAVGLDGYLWFDEGDLTNFTVGNAATLTEAVFDLALVADGWFSFVVDTNPPASAGRRSVADVLADVQPQVAEWRSLVQRVPLDGLVHLARTPPGAEIQIRSDQWRVLTVINPVGSTVRDVLDILGSEYVVALRLVCELLDAGLVEMLPTNGTTAGGTDTDPPLVASVPGATWVAPRPKGRRTTKGQPVPAHEVEVLPPPDGVPWVAPSVAHEPVTSDSGWTP